MSAAEIFILLGGIGLFLFGMSLMSSGLKNAAGDQLRVILEKATGNRLTGILAGLGVTVCIQSSSATDVMVIGFVSSGLMTLPQALGVIMGADIGTTITAQITAFDIGTYAPLILFIGSIITLFVKHQIVREIGQVILGFGMLFEGITLMKSAITPLSQTQGFVDLLSALSNPFLIILFGLLFTALLQSSSSATVIFQAFAIQGIVDYNTAVYLIIGAAIGAVTPNLLAGLTATRAGRRCSVMNLIFNLLRGCVSLLLITVFPQFMTIVQNLSPGDVARQIANTHTLFAIISVIVLLPFQKIIVRLAEKFVSISDAEKRRASDRRLVYLVQTDRIPPAVALEQAHREISRMGHIAVNNLILSLDSFFQKDEGKRFQVLSTEEDVDYLTEAIMDKMLELRSMELSVKNMNHLYRMLQIIDDMERISDHAENIAEYEEQLHSGRARISEAGISDLKELAELTVNSLKTSLEIFETENFTHYNEQVHLEQSVDDKQDEIISRNVERLMSGICDPKGSVIFSDMAIDLERCSDHAMNIADALK